MVTCLPTKNAFFGLCHQQPWGCDYGILHRWQVYGDQRLSLLVSDTTSAQCLGIFAFAFSPPSLKLYPKNTNTAPHLGDVFKYFYFHPYLGKISNLTNIFQMGWNHQLVLNCSPKKLTWHLTMDPWKRRFVMKTTKEIAGRKSDFIHQNWSLHLISRPAVSWENPGSQGGWALKFSWIWPTCFYQDYHTYF